ncbi:YcxB family protein [Aridibaculum aurantiacum]|uniref:YcxB family protein n=1 Tax=Aridibaculum aurantiacum TaxID=2810307 RepID=UPI001A958A19|nr:YcxB family protein [Aridibaculum aurantiacum]
MHIRVRLTEKIINDCLQLHYHDQPTGRRMRQRLYLIPLVMLGIAAFILYNELRSPAVGQNFYMALLYVSFAFIYYFFMRHRMMRAGGKLLRNLGENSSFEMDVNEEELTTTTKSQSFSQPWSSFTGGLISNNNVLLYQANNSFSMFNHSFFEAGDFDRFKQLVQDNVQPVIVVNKD